MSVSNAFKDFKQDILMQNEAISGEIVRPNDATKTLKEEKSFLLAN